MGVWLGILGAWGLGVLAWGLALALGRLALSLGAWSWGFDLGGSALGPSTRVESGLGQRGNAWAKGRLLLRVQLRHRLKIRWVRLRVRLRLKVQA